MILATAVYMEEISNIIHLVVPPLSTLVSRCSTNIANVLCCRRHRNRPWFYFCNLHLYTSASGPIHVYLWLRPSTSLSVIFIVVGGRDKQYHRPRRRRVLMNTYSYGSINTLLAWPRRTDVN